MAEPSQCALFQVKKGLSLEWHFDADYDRVAHFDARSGSAGTKVVAKCRYTEARKLADHTPRPKVQNPHGLILNEVDSALQPAWYVKLYAPLISQLLMVIQTFSFARLDTEIAVFCMSVCTPYSAVAIC